MVGVIKMDTAVIQRIKDLYLEGLGSIKIHPILVKEVKDPSSSIYGMDIPPDHSNIEEIKNKLRTRDLVKEVPGITEAEWTNREIYKVKTSDYVEMKEYIKKNPNTTRADIAKKWGIAETYIYTVQDKYSGKHGTLNWKVLWGKGAAQLPYVTENAEKILKAMKENPALTTGTKIRDHPDVKLSIKQFNSAMAALKKNQIDADTGKSRFDISDDLHKKIKKIKGGTIRTVEETLVKNKILDRQQVKTIFTHPRIALQEFFAGSTGTVFEHAFPRVLINKKFDGKHLFDKATRDAFEVIGTRTSPYLNFAKVKTDNLQAGLVRRFLDGEITRNQYYNGYVDDKTGKKFLGINEIRKQFKNATGGYEIGYIDFDKNKNPTPVTKLKKVTLPKGQWGPGTAQKITPFANAKYTANLLKNFLDKNYPDKDIFSSLKRNMDVSKISGDTVKEYESLAGAYKQAEPHLYNTQKFVKFADKNLDNPVVRALMKAEQSVKPGDTREISDKRFLKRVLGPPGRPELGLIEVIKAATRDDNNICQAVFGKKGAQKLVFGKQQGGTASGCGPEMKRALQETPEQTLTKITEVGSSKLKNAARGLLTVFKRFGPTAGKYGAIAAVGALAQPLVKEFMNDDPSTYLTDPDQQAGLLDALIEGERPKPRSEILDWGTTAGAVGATAAAVPGTGALYKYRRGLLEKKIPKAGPFTEKGVGPGKVTIGPRGKGYGVTRAALGPVGKFIAGAYTPAGLLAHEPLRIAQMRREGESWGEVAKSPTLWMGPAFADTMTKMATAGMKPGSRLARALSLGMSRPMLKNISRRFGMPGLALSAGLSGYDLWKDYKKKRGFFARDEE